MDGSHKILGHHNLQEEGTKGQVSPMLPLKYKYVVITSTNTIHIFSTSLAILLHYFSLGHQDLIRKKADYIALFLKHVTLQTISSLENGWMNGCLQIHKELFILIFYFILA